MRITLVTDAWEPQMNGVVRTLSRVVQECREMGHEVDVISPADGFKTIPLPTYNEIELALGARDQIAKRITDFEPDAIHIATEGTLGMTARSICLKWGWPFTTSYHTKFPEYVNARFPFVPHKAGYAFMRWFHNAGDRLMVATPSMREELEKRGFTHIVAWARGVDTEMFHPSKRAATDEDSVYAGLQRPVIVNVGRVAVEKNLEAFLKLDLPGTKVIVGHGPQLEELQEHYPDVVFTGSKFGEELARYFADADAFVFPSWTDTFGLVILEALACGVPVAAYPVMGPRDVIGDSGTGVLSEDLRQAALDALQIPADRCRAWALKYSWASCTRQFLDNAVAAQTSHKAGL